MNRVSAEFIGHQPISNGSIRLYNIIGPHEREGSTVTVRTLIEEGIPVDLPLKDLIQELQAIKGLVEN